MGNTKEYLDYLNNEVGIAPAASQEELDLAQALADKYAEHGLDPEVQEFPASSSASLLKGIVMVIVFVGMILVGIGNVGLMFVGLVLVAAGIALLGLTYTGNDVLSKIGPRAHSQNVVAVHRAEGEGNDRNRPIVILAHYDTPRVDPLASSQFAVAKKYLAIIAPNALCAVAVCTLIQILVFLPEAARRTFWIIGIIASLPVLLWGIALIARRFSAYADGAVGNKSSVAALLSVMDRVCSGDKPRERNAAPAEDFSEPLDVKDSIVRPATRLVTHTEVEEVEGKRHGEAVLRELGILPEDCDITYIAPKVRTYEVEETIEYPDEPEEPKETEAKPADATSSDLGATTELGDAVEGDADATRPMEVLREPRLTTTEDASGFDVDSLSQLEDGEATDEGPLSETDHSGISTMADEDAEAAASAPRAEREVPAAVDDPDWGKSSYEPSNTNVSNVARRAALFDLPDVAGTENDGLSADDEVSDAAVSYGMPTQAAPVTTASPMAQRLAEASAQVAAAPAPIRLDEGASASQFVGASQVAQPADIEVLGAPASNTAAPAQEQNKRRGLKGLFSRKRKQADESMSEWLGVDEDFNAKTSGESIGSWDHFDDDDSQRGHWKGGAARSIALRGGLADLPEIGADSEGESEAAAAPSDPEATTVMKPSDANPYVEGSEQGLFTEVPNMDPVPESDTFESDGVEDSTESSNEPDGEASNADAENDAVFGGEVGEEVLETAPVDRTLRDAILAMNDEELKAHDVWFIATGASELGHAGISEFVAAHRKDLRGAFIINLESVGAGELTALTYEGFGRTRRADRRVIKLLSSIASDMHLELGQLRRTWADTEATPAMRKSLRAVTLMGMGDNELPAYTATAEDSYEVVDEEKVVDVVAIINELIKRS